MKNKSYNVIVVFGFSLSPCLTGKREKQKAHTQNLAASLELKCHRRTTAAAKIVVCDGNIRCVTRRRRLSGRSRWRFLLLVVYVLVSSTFHG